MRSFTSGGKITKKKLFPQIILSIYSWDLGRQVWGPNPNESLSVAGVMNGFWGLYYSFPFGMSMTNETNKVLRTNGAEDLVIVCREYCFIPDAR